MVIPKKDVAPTSSRIGHPTEKQFIESLESRNRLAVYRNLSGHVSGLQVSSGHIGNTGQVAFQPVRQQKQDVQEHRIKETTNL